MHVIYARQDPSAAPEPSLFLAGPTPRSPDVLSWRPEALRILEALSYAGTVFVPEEPGEGGFPEIYADEQTHWEWACLERAGTIVFWIPRDLRTLPGFTTNIEFGLYCRSGKVLLGFPPGAARMRYLELLAQANNIPIFHELSALLQAAARLNGMSPAAPKETPS